MDHSDYFLSIKIVRGSRQFILVYSNNRLSGRVLIFSCLFQTDSLMKTCYICLFQQILVVKATI
jgi:hypothetical protein